MIRQHVTEKKIFSLIAKYDKIDATTGKGIDEVPE